MGWASPKVCREKAHMYLKNGLSEQQRAILDCLRLCPHPVDTFGHKNERRAPCNRGCPQRGRCWIMRTPLYKAVMKLLRVNINEARALVLARLLELSEESDSTGPEVYKDALEGMRRAAPARATRERRHAPDPRAELA